LTESRSIIAAALVALSYVIGHRVKNSVKDEPYECGISPTGDARGRFSVKILSGGDALHPLRY
jgi:NADH:ubiquinone oxidoreductase subunit 3 (subunit A)